jgi:threonine synthase
MPPIEGSYPVDRPGILGRDREYLPVNDETPLFSLGEGFTPLVHARWLGDELGLRHLYLKCEGQNPTGSFKDRGMVLAVAKAIEENAQAIVCASTGNTSASAAAYGALAGMEVIVLIPRGNIAIGKLAQSLHYGAKVVAVDGNFDDALRLIREITERRKVTLVNSVNPMRLEGQKTGAFEICDALKRAPEYLAIPVGNAGNISAYWAGFKQYRQAGKTDSLPKMLGFEAAGSAPIVENRVIDHPETLATAIKIGNPASWHKAVAARDESGGVIEAVTDEEIVDAYKMVSRLEGIGGIRSRRHQDGASGPAGTRCVHCLHPHRLRPEGSGHGHRPGSRRAGNGRDHRFGRSRSGMGTCSRAGRRVNPSPAS